MHIAVLLSGGVDSSVSLRLLQEQGHQVTAFYLKMWLEDELAFLGDCPWREDVKYAEAVCQQAGVSLNIIPIQREYFDRVVDYTIDEVKAGRTPNPDIMCNNRIKFGLFLEKIGNEFEKIATGHYARSVMQGTAAQLQISPDPIKDQTYFLAHLEQQQLRRALFPIGQMTKKQVRQKAFEFDLPNKTRKDSQGICFLGKLKYDEFLRHYVGERPGWILEQETGKKLVQHKGYWFFTIGQRQGIGLSGGPWYVVEKKPAENLVYVSRQYHDDSKQRDTFSTEKIHWIFGEPPSGADLTGAMMRVKLRHGPTSYPCVISLAPDGGASVKIEGNDQGFAPGQFAVFYVGEVCLGAGKIAANSISNEYS